jgi:PA-IL-like protein
VTGSTARKLARRLRRSIGWTWALTLAAAFVLAASSSASTGSKTLSIPATTTLLKSGVTLARGESATIVATGTISYGSQNPACSGAAISPEGCAAESICPVGGGCGALIVRIGDGPLFIVGKSKTVDGPGAIWLGINDVAGDFADNTGSFGVTITTKARTEVAKVLQIKTGHLYLRRAGTDRVAPLRAGDVIYLGDELLTSQDGRVALEFEIGGRVRIGPGAHVTVTGERSVTSGPESGSEDTGLRFLWNHSGSSATVEIQTNGGVIGIKG